MSDALDRIVDRAVDLYDWDDYGTDPGYDLPGDVDAAIRSACEEVARECVKVGDVLWGETPDPIDTPEGAIIQYERRIRTLFPTAFEADDVR